MDAAAKGSAKWGDLFRVLARQILSDYAAENTLLTDMLAERIEGAVEDWIEGWLGPEGPRLTVLRNPQLRLDEPMSDEGKGDVNG